MFASCPIDLNGCTGDPVSLSVIEGESAKFNATVIHTPGGSCGIRQEITRVRLMKINERFGVDDVQLLSCPTERTLCSDGRVSLDRGRDPGFEFVFTLSNAVDGDAGLYEVIVEGRHPSGGSTTQLRKRFNLDVNGKQNYTSIPTLDNNNYATVSLLCNSATHNYH